MPAAESGGGERRRHDLVWVSPRDWADVLRSHADLTSNALLAQWTMRGWPLIVRRRAPTDPPGLVPVGAPLPPAAGRLRVALPVPDTAVERTERPPLLSEVAAAADPRWAESIEELVALGERHRATPAVHGSLLWQHLTGLAYLHESSDLDLLWPTPAQGSLRDLLAGVDGVSRRASPRLDGEVELAPGRSAHWRELHDALRCGCGGDVAEKFLDGVRLVPLDGVLGAQAVQP
jgi:phosphoribosyl-dephospho-CoA transferase